MEPITLAWAAEAIRAQAIGALDGIAASVVIDTRVDVRNALFFALAGERTDGHRFVRQALEGAAAAAVVERAIPDVAGTQLVVPDALLALGELASSYRSRFAIPVVGVTGSVGKTTTREMIAAVLRSRYRVLASDKNFNTDIGVPQTLFELSDEHQVAIVEMAMRGLGQIDRLAEIARPTIGVVTKIGQTHIELLGSQERILEAKAELLARLPAGGVAVIPANDRFTAELRNSVPAGVRILTFGLPASDSEGADVRIVPGGGSPELNGTDAVIIGQERAAFALRAVGAHLLYNAGAAFAVAHALEIPIADAAEALAAWEGAPGRMVVRRADEGWTVLDDCYNAGPESMEAALATLSQRAGARGVAVLGDMRELGDYAPSVHRFVGQKAVDAGIRLLVTVGELAEIAADEAVRYAKSAGSAPLEVRRYRDSRDAAADIRTLIGPDDTILVKGSRAMEMETIVAALTGHWERDGHG